MSEKTKFILFIIIVASLVVLMGLFIRPNTMKSGHYDDLARCISQSGAKFYGTFWCSHCYNQKKMFGQGASLLPYVECSTPDGQDSLSVCTEAGIEGFPTWVFPDGTKMPGEQPIEILAGKTSCSLPS